jgi:hypothetical protein
MARVSKSQRWERSAALRLGRFSPESIANELNRRRFTRWSFDQRAEQGIFELSCGVKITLYIGSGSVLVQGRLFSPSREEYMAHLSQMLPSYTTWQVT